MMIIAGYDCQVAGKVQFNNEKKEKTLINRTHGFRGSFLFLISFLYDYERASHKILIFVQFYFSFSVARSMITKERCRWIKRKRNREKNVHRALFEGIYEVKIFLVSTDHKIMSVHMTNS